MTLIERIAELNAAEFGTKDYYSNPENLRALFLKPEYGYITVRCEGKFAGYIIYAIWDGAYVEGLRSAVVREYRGRGLGMRLFRRIFGIADGLALPYWTYTSHDNYESINSHVRAGMRVSRIYKGKQNIWVEMIYRSKK